jgi:AcrR family transcriptional regulator
MAASTRDRLLRASWRCVRRRGLKGATSRAITTAADANLGAITYYFGSKDALVAEAVGAAIERLVQPAVAALQDDALDPVSRVLEAIRRLEQAFERSTRDAPAYLEVLVHSGREPQLGERVRRIFADLRSVLAAQIAEQQRAAALPEWIEPDAMAGLLLAVAQGVVLQTLVDGDGPSHSAMASQFAGLLFASRVSP